MVIFDRLQVSEDGKKLYIDAHVNKAEYFNNNYIAKVVILTQDQVSETNPLLPSTSFVYTKEIQGDKKEINLALDATVDFTYNLHSLSDKLLFVYVICTGTPSDDTPCRLDELTTLGVTFDTFKVYQRVLELTKGINDTCEVPEEFMNFMAIWFGFKAAIESEHFITAIDLWNKLEENNTGTNNSNCGCHG